MGVEQTTAPDAVPGIIASLVVPLANAAISTFAVATFDTDHLLVQDIAAAESALTAAGHTVHRCATKDLKQKAQAPSPRIRPAKAGDSSDLAILADAATRRLVGWLWDTVTAPGQSAFEVGRTQIHSDIDSTSHHSQWTVAELDGVVLGGLNSFLLAPSTVPKPRNTPPALAPVNELKALAVHTWYISVASVLPESRGLGTGQLLLEEAERQALDAGADKVTLLVASFNPDAKRLYERCGYSEWYRRSFVAFPGSNETGDWILMVKRLDPSAS